MVAAALGRASIAGALLFAVGSGCGYQSAHAPRDEVGPFAVVGLRAYAPHAFVIESAEAGARSELGRAGQLASCAPAGGAATAPGRCPAIALEILRVDEEAAAIWVDRGDARLVARGARVTVIGRARVRAGAGGATLRDTGDMSATEVFARPDDPAEAAAAREQASRLVSRRLGERLVRRLLGRPEPTFE